MTTRVCAGVLAACVLTASAASAQTGADKLEITAFAVNMGNVGTGTTAVVDIKVNLWSTVAERDRLVATMADKGEDALQTPLPDGGRRIVLGMDRYIGFAEARNQPRTMDYPFTLIEIRVDKDGNGEGKLAVATSIDINKKKGVIELEHYSSEPVRLNNLKVKVVR